MTTKQKAKFLRALANDSQLLEVARCAIEDQLISMRDSRIATVGRNNGFVCKEKDGKPSDIIRFGPETGVAIALAAIADTLEAKR